MDSIIVPVLLFAFGIALAANVRGIGQVIGALFRFRLIHWRVQPGVVSQIRVGRIVGTFICTSSAMAAGSVAFGSGSRPMSTVDDVVILVLGVVGLASGAIAWQFTRRGDSSDQP